LANDRFRNSTASGEVGDIDLAQHIEERRSAGGVLLQILMRDEILLHEDGEDRAEAESIGTRTHLEMIVGELGGLGAARGDDDKYSMRVVGNLAQRRARGLETVRLPGVLADEHRDLAILEIGRWTTSGEPPLDPELTGLFLCQRIRGVGHSERAPRGGAVCA